jgi:hypothetical protein
MTSGAIQASDSQGISAHLPENSWMLPNIVPNLPDGNDEEDILENDKTDGEKEDMIW